MPPKPDKKFPFVPGEMFTLRPVIDHEKFNMDRFEEDLLEQIFDFMIRDFRICAETLFKSRYH
jgi:hypothetical protein